MHARRKPCTIMAAVGDGTASRVIKRWKNRLLTIFKQMRGNVAGRILDFEGSLTN